MRKDASRRTGFRASRLTIKCEGSIHSSRALFGIPHTFFAARVRARRSNRGLSSMIVNWAWRASTHVDPRLKMRAMFVAAALRERDVSMELATASPDSPLGKLLGEWPQTVGILLWPYQ